MTKLALPFGSIRTRFGGSGAGNNGVKSVTSYLGPDTARIRVGVYNELRDKIDDADFVLSKFTHTEQNLMAEITPVVHQSIDAFVMGELEAHYSYDRNQASFCVVSLHCRNNTSHP